jgi:hypothetical protein
LRQLQREIDQMRAVSGSPSHTTRVLAQLIEDRLTALQQMLERLSAASRELEVMARRLEGRR